MLQIDEIFCRYLPVIEKLEGEEDEVYAERVQTAIADNMRISKTKFTYSDKVRDIPIYYF